MKMKKEHYQKIETAINAAEKRNPGIKAQYQNEGKPKSRYAWDMLHYSEIDGKTGTAFICSELYSYLNDNHINTALNKIVRDYA